MVCSLVQEREGVLTFVHTVCDEVRLVGCNQAVSVSLTRSCKSYSG